MQNEMISYDLNKMCPPSQGQRRMTFKIVRHLIISNIMLQNPTYDLKSELKIIYPRMANYL